MSKPSLIILELSMMQFDRGATVILFNSFSDMIGIFGTGFVIASS